MGTSAGDFSTTGDFNVFIGYRAGDSNTSGDDNTIIGNEADVGSNNLSFATAIGAGAVVSTSNTIALGRGDGSDTVVVPGKLQVDTLGTAGSTQLCLNGSNRLAPCSSSLRYKTNLQPFTGGLEIINRLRPVTFTWLDGGRRDLGLGAEAVESVEPLLVTYNKGGEVEGVKYDRVAVVLLNAVKEQQLQIARQAEQIQSQESQLQRQGRLIKQQQAQLDGLKRLICRDNPDAEVCK